MWPSSAPGGAREHAVVELRAPRELSVVVRGESYEAVLTPDLEAGGYSIEVPALPGVVTEADSIAEARPNVREAVSLWLDARGVAAPAHRRVG